MSKSKYITWDDVPIPEDIKQTVDVSTAIVMLMQDAAKQYVFDAFSYLASNKSKVAIKGTFKQVVKACKEYERLQHLQLSGVMFDNPIDIEHRQDSLELLADLNDEMDEHTKYPFKKIEQRVANILKNAGFDERYYKDIAKIYTGGLVVDRAIEERKCMFKQCNELHLYSGNLFNETIRFNLNGIKYRIAMAMDSHKQYTRGYEIDDPVVLPQIVKEAFLPFVNGENIKKMCKTAAAKWDKQ